MNQLSTLRTAELTPDLEQAQAFLDLLDPFSGFTFQTFDDDKERLKALKAQQRASGRKAYDPHAKILNGLLDDHAQDLARRNAQGAGVFVTINETDGTGRQEGNITRIRGAFCEIDRPGGDLEEMKAEASVGGKLPTIVESSPGKYHFYLLTDGNNLAKEEFSALQKAFIRKMERFGPDEAIHDLPRVMRLPGFFHRKGEPFMTRIVEEGERFEADEIREALAPHIVEEAPRNPQATRKREAKAPSGEVIEYALEGFHASVNRTAMRNYSAWVPLLFPTATEYQGGYRVESADLGRNLEEVLAFHPDGIRDFGEERGCTAIDIMMRYGIDIRAQQSANNAAFALCDAMCIKPETLGWQSRPGDALEEWRGAPSAESMAAISKDAQRMAEEIHKLIAEALQLPEEERGKIKVDPRPLDAIMRGAFWFPSGSRVWHITGRGNLVEHSEGDAWGQLEATFGKAVDDATIDQLVEMVDTGHKPGTLEERKARQRLAKDCRAVTKHKMMFYLKRHNQRRRVSRYVDMFASEAAMLLKPELVVISQPHAAFPSTRYDPKVVEDYKQHFPRFDIFLEFIAAARFAPDRKKAYLWMRLLSDWGKDLLLDGVLGRDGLGVVASVSEAEVEKMFEGGPVGRDPVEFLHAWVLLINEFKKVNGEMKQLERSIRLAPKHQLSAEVPVYAKVFTSAEGVASLAGDNGVEDQFANRFSAFEEGANRITEREMYIADSDHYLESLRGYAAEVLNSEVGRYRAMGEKGSRNTAKAHIDEFHRKYGIAEIHGRLDDRIPEIAADIRAWLLSEEQSFNTDVMVEGTKRLLVRPAAHLDRWVEANISRSEQRTIKLKKEAIFEAMSVDGKGARGRHRIHGHQKRGVLLTA